MMKSISFQNSHIIVYLIIFISCCGIYVSCAPDVSTTTSAFKCLPDQSTVLLEFKQEFSFQKLNISYYYYHCSMYSNPFYDYYIHPQSYPKMKFWKEGKDCCSWSGVTCDMKTGQVVDLDLSYSWLQGPLRSNSSLFKLPELQKVNLAHNNFSFSKIPSEFGQFSRLTDLILSYSMFSGEVPSEISYLTNLVYLGLSSFKSYDETSFLYLKRVDFTRFPEKIFQLPKLELILVPCNPLLSGFLPQFHNSSSLRVLNLDAMNFSGKLPDSIGKLESLIGFSIGKYIELPKFQTLALGSCNLSEFPSFLKTQDQLEKLDLSSNRIEGQIPKWFWGIAKKKLEMLDLSHNKLQGSLDASPLFTSFFEISENKKTYLKVLDISKNQFSGTIPQWLGNFGSSLEILNLHGNNFHGNLPQMFRNGTMLNQEAGS
ncbi:hypothetical protein FNV43_RR01631 [Rhamnella rubrinervis]|uniref:Leucine-rich repeat-containing N-terminal plant-type domain-containing protein n=1 Tax=Rhamnella rubrinervis TaxID=2594499 RepID=A0A8K0HST6_9ROSA|nr:hypothetical protein FNV43_RR01631 [Rhamnella rubrinervis]